MHIQRGAAGLGEGLGDRLGAGAGAGVENALAGGHRDAGEVVPAAEEAILVALQRDILGDGRDFRVAYDAAHQHEQVQADLHRLAGQGILGLDLHPAVDLLADLADAPADEVDAVVALGVDIEVLVFLAEEAQVHIEAVDFRIRKLLLHLDRLLDGGNAADLRALCVAGLDIAGTDAVDEADGLGLGGNALVHTGGEPVFEVLIRDHAVVYAVTVLFLLPRFEQFEARGEHDGLGEHADAVGEHDIVAVLEAVDELDPGAEENGRTLEAGLEGGDHVLRRRHVREEAVPGGDMAAEMVGLFDQDRGVSEVEEAGGRFHAGDTATDDDNGFFHSANSI